MKGAGTAPAAQLDALIRADFTPEICAPARLSAWCSFWGEAQSRLFYQDRCGANDDAYKANLEAICTRLMAEGGYPHHPARTARALRVTIEGVWLGLMTMNAPYSRDEALATVHAFAAAFFPRQFGSAGQLAGWPPGPTIFLRKIRPLRKRGARGGGLIFRRKIVALQPMTPQKQFDPPPRFPAPSAQRGARMTPLQQVLSLPIWQGPVTAAPLDGGITNQNFRVRDGDRQAVVRLGGDIPVHQILRFNELAASRAAHAAGVSPAVLHHQPGVLVLDYIDGATMTAETLRDPDHLDQAIDLVAKAHRMIPRHLRGPALCFWVFHVIRDYAATLTADRSRHADALSGLLDDAATLERASGPIDLIFGHNDLLPANFLHDGARMWLIDWDYAGFNSPLFDLGGLSANCGLTETQETHLLTRYFAALPDKPLIRRYRAMKAAAALREALWSMVSETRSEIAFDYPAYTATTLHTYRLALDAYRQT